MVQLWLYTHHWKAEWSIWLLQLNKCMIGVFSFLKNLSVLQMLLLHPNCCIKIKILIALSNWKFVAISKLSLYQFSCHLSVSSQIYISLKLTVCRQLCGENCATVILQEVIWQKISSEKPQVHSYLLLDT